MAQENSYRIAVLMTVHNRRDTTLKCMEHLTNSASKVGWIDMTVFLTEDGSTDGTAIAISNAFPSTRIIHGDGSLFWNRGMFCAWKMAAQDDFDYYFWVNDDTFIFEDTLTKMLICAKAHSNQAIIVGSTTSSDGSGIITYGGRTGVDRRHDGVLVINLDHERNCQTMNGNLVIIPRFVFKTLGPNDPYYHHALGDIDYGLRATEAGISIVIAPGICGICDLHEKLPDWMDPSQPLYKRCSNFFSPLGNNPFEYFHFRKRHFGWLAATGTFLSNFLHLLFPSLWLKRNKTHTP